MVSHTNVSLKFYIDMNSGRQYQASRKWILIGGMALLLRVKMLEIYKRRDIGKRVYVSHVPLGITELEFREVFSFYGDIL